MSERHQENGAEFIAPKHETEHHKEHVEHHQHTQEQEKTTTHNLEAIARQVEQHAISGEEYSRGEQHKAPQHPVLVNKELKLLAYNRALTRARKQLSAPSRAFSKFIHNKSIDKPSEIIGNTIARPSGMVGGAFFALLGSSALLWISRHYGYEYNYLAFILLFGIGLLVGISVEGIIRLVKQR